jgi:lysine decarboxylase/arginine decarboxylase
MMDQAGPLLTGESINEAVAFRQAVARYGRELGERGEWFFTTWGPDRVPDGTGALVDFADADPARLATDHDAWVLHPGDAWHGYGDIEDNYAMLDPIKVSVVMPGIGRDGAWQDRAIPAALFSAFLDARGIVCEKTTDFTVLFLFSMGVTSGKWGTLLTAMLDFKRAYDTDRPLAEVLPGIVAANPAAYAGLGLRGLADQMASQMRATGQFETQKLAFEQLPAQAMEPRAAYDTLVRGDVERIGLEALPGRTLATGIVPYPPGIPLLMPGERAGRADEPFIRYLQALQDFDQRFPGFGHDIHGVDASSGAYELYVLKEA